MLDSLRSEILELRDIANVSLALVDFALALEPDCSMERAAKRFVMRPKNFVTFEVHYKRANNLTVTLRGNPSEFERQPELGIVDSLSGYSAFTLESAAQLGAAAMYIKRANELFDRGRGRPLLTPKTTES